MKQRNSGFYSTIAFALADTIVRIPLGFLDGFLFGSIQYWYDFVRVLFCSHTVATPLPSPLTTIALDVAWQDGRPCGRFQPIPVLRPRHVARIVRTRPLRRPCRVL